MASLRFGMMVRTDHTLEGERTLLYYDNSTQELVVDRSHSSLNVKHVNASDHRAPFVLPSGNTVSNPQVHCVSYIPTMTVPHRPYLCMYLWTIPLLSGLWTARWWLPVESIRHRRQVEVWYCLCKKVPSRSTLWKCMIFGICMDDNTVLLQPLYFFGV